MTPKERAEALQKFYAAWRADPYGDRQSMLDEFERAFTDAIVEDRKSRPHIFVGRLDRSCELCGNPDRDEIHLVKREWMGNAIKQEREACAGIAEKYEQEKRARSEQFKDKNTPTQAAHMSTAITCNKIKREIRARSDS